MPTFSLPATPPLSTANKTRSRSAHFKLHGNHHDPHQLYTFTPSTKAFFNYREIQLPLHSPLQLIFVGDNCQKAHTGLLPALQRSSLFVVYNLPTSLAVCDRKHPEHWPTSCVWKSYRAFDRCRFGIALCIYLISELAVDRSISEPLIYPIDWHPPSPSYNP